MTAYGNFNVQYLFSEKEILKGAGDVLMFYNINKQKCNILVPPLSAVRRFGETVFLLVAPKTKYLFISEHVQYFTQFPKNEFFYRAIQQFKYKFMKLINYKFIFRIS